MLRQVVVGERDRYPNGMWNGKIGTKMRDQWKGK